MSETPRDDLQHRRALMVGRDTRERGRTATSLELLFDLTFVVAFGLAGGEAAHLAAEGQLALSALGFAMAGFGIIWAWINFTWFASAFDTDDWLFRLTTMLQMIGVVVFALGLPPFFAALHHGHADNRMMVLGYVVMRVAMSIHWGRAYREAPAVRSTARVYLATILLAQAGWVALALAHTSLTVFVVLALGLVVVELLGPVVGERLAGGDARGSVTPWHPHHVAERYGLLAIIALGEGVVGTVAALSSSVDAAGGWTLEAGLVVVAGVGLTFGMWWQYFAVRWGDGLHARPERAFGWGYGHIPLFIAIAATGAGLHLAGYVIEGEADVTTTIAVAAVAVPVGVFVSVQILLYAALFRRFDAFHVVLLAATGGVLAVAVLLAAAGVPMGWCLVVTMLAPVAVVVGYETVGHRHHADDLAGLSPQA